MKCRVLKTLEKYDKALTSVIWWVSIAVIYAAALWMSFRA